MYFIYYIYNIYIYISYTIWKFIHVLMPGILASWIAGFAGFCSPDGGACHFSRDWQSKAQGWVGMVQWRRCLGKPLGRLPSTANSIENYILICLVIRRPQPDAGGARRRRLLPRQKDRETERQTDRQTDCSGRGRQAGRQTDCSGRGRQAGRQAGRPADGRTDRQTDRQTDSQTDRQTGTGRQAGQTGRGRQTTTSFLVGSEGDVRQGRSRPQTLQMLPQAKDREGDKVCETETKTEKRQRH